MNPRFISAYILRGITHYYKLYNYQEAINDLGSAIELKANDAVVYYKRGLIYSNLRKYQEAIKDYNKAIKLNPKDADAYYDKGFAYAELGDYQQAIKNYNKAAELNPENMSAACVITVGSRIQT